MMSQSPLRRRIVSTFILLVIVSSIVPAVTLAGDASGAHATALSQSPSQAHPQFDGTIVAQQSGKDGSTTKNGTNTKISRKEKITALVEWLKVRDFGYKSLSPKEKRQIKNDLRALASRTLSKQQEKQRLGRITNILGYEPPTNPLEFATGLAEAEGSLNHTITNVLDEKLGGFTVAKRFQSMVTRKLYESCQKSVGWMWDMMTSVDSVLKRLNLASEGCRRGRRALTAGGMQIFV